MLSNYYQKYKMINQYEFMDRSVKIENHICKKFKIQN